jgi:hypothetical protein
MAASSDMRHSASQGSERVLLVQLRALHQIRTTRRPRCSLCLVPCQGTNLLALFQQMARGITARVNLKARVTCGDGQIDEGASGDAESRRLPYRI